MAAPAKDNALQKGRRGLSRYFIDPIVPLLVATGLSPDQLTLIGLAIAFGAAALAGAGYLFAAGVLVLVAAVFDMFDGAVARATNKASPRGALLDSTLDRVSEEAVLFGLLVHVALRGQTHEALLVFLAASGSVLVSYVKARAEGLGIECNVGFFTRPERVLLVALALLSGFLLVPLYLLAVLSFATALQRFWHVWRKGGASAEPRHDAG